jgi:glutamyl-tRNA reductase
MNELKAIAISYKDADINIRGKFALSQEEKNALYLQLRYIFDINEALIVSTCNRTEIFYVHKENLGGQITGLLGSLRGIPKDEISQYFTQFNTSFESLSHLYRVAIGLESQVLGDIQIFGQVKQAYQESVDHDMAGTLLHRAMHTLFYTHKRVCQETNFKDGAASISYNAVKVLKDLNLATLDSSILVAGAGKMGTDVCKHLVKLGYTNITVTNRTISRAEALQETLNIAILPFERLSASFNQYNIIISTIGTTKPIFDEKLISDQAHPFACIDLCAPKSFTNSFIDHFNGSYINIDGIGSITESTLAQRQSEVSNVELIIAESLSDLEQWTIEYAHTREIKKFKETLDQLRKEAIGTYLKEANLVQNELIEEVSKAIIQRIVKLPAIQLKQICERDRADQLSQTLNELFNIENQFSKPKTVVL